MALANFISTVWSETLFSQIDKKYIAVANCNREFEGDIKNCGSSVKICGIGSINVTDYDKNYDMSNPQDLSTTTETIFINQAKCFNFQIDDVERAQTNPKIMDAAMRTAASALANEADKFVFSLYQGTDNIFSSECTPENILTNIIKAREILYKANVSSSEEVVLEVSPDYARIKFDSLKTSRDIKTGFYKSANPTANYSLFAK